MGFDYTRRQWSTIIVISIADFCNALCVALQAPFYPQVAENKGCTATEYGLVFGVFELVVFIISPFYGAHINRIGPKLLFNVGILTTGTCAILFGLLNNINDHVPFIACSFIIRIVEALGNAAFLTASFAIIAKEFPDNVATMFAENKGCTATEYGLVFGVFELVVFIISPFYGAHINRIGPKLLFNVGILTTGTCAILFGLLNNINDHVPFIACSFIIRIVEALGNAAFLTASFAIIAKEFPDNVATMFASLETFFGLGLIVGPTLGGALYQYGGNNFFLPFGVLGSALFCAAVMSCVALPKAHDDEDLSPSGRETTMMTLLKIPGVLLAVISIISTSMSIGFLQATLEPHFRKQNMNFTPVILGLIFVINGGLYALSAPLWGWICDRPRVKPKYVTVVGCVFIAAGFLIIGPAPFFNMPTTTWMSIVGLVLHGLGMGSQLVASFADALGTAIASGLPNSIETYGLVSGMWTCTFALGAFIGPSLSGVLFDSIGFEYATVFISVLHVCVAIIVVIYLCSCDRTYKMDVSVSAGDLLQIDGTLDESVLVGDKFPQPRVKSRKCGISVERSRPSAMNSLIACTSIKNRQSPWSQRTPKYRPSYGSLDHRYRGAQK